jgi:hypothetical protein
MVQVTYKYKDQYVQDCLYVYIAVFISSNARLRLYDMLDRLDKAVVYYDNNIIV